MTMYMTTGYQPLSKVILAEDRLILHSGSRSDQSSLSLWDFTLSSMLNDASYLGYKRAVRLAMVPNHWSGLRNGPPTNKTTDSQLHEHAKYNIFDKGHSMLVDADSVSPEMPYKEKLLLLGTSSRTGGHFD